MTRFYQIKSPGALAAFGAFFVPEPFGTCLVLASAIWWLASLERAQPLLGSLRYAAFWVSQKCFLIGRAAAHAAKLLTKDEARRIAANFAKLPELVRQPGKEHPSAAGIIIRGTRPAR
jgi:hypothetical protein